MHVELEWQREPHKISCLKHFYLREPHWIVAGLQLHLRISQPLVVDCFLAVCLKAKKTSASTSWSVEKDNWVYHPHKILFLVPSRLDNIFYVCICSFNTPLWWHGWSCKTWGQRARTSLIALAADSSPLSDWIFVTPQLLLVRIQNSTAAIAKTWYHDLDNAL